MARKEKAPPEVEQVPLYLEPQAPRPLCDLIDRCLGFNPDARPARMSEVQGSLDVLAEKLVRSPKDRLEAVEW